MASDIWRQLAKATVRLYPAAWRERYQDEVVALLDATEPGPAVVADMLRGAVRMRSGVADSVLAFVMIFARAFAWTWVAVLAAWLVFIIVVGPIMLLALGHALSEWPAWTTRQLTVTPYLGVHPVLLLYSTVVSLPAWLLLRVSGMGRRYPKTSRALYVSAFMWFSVWLMRIHMIELPLAFAGWLVAVRLFPLPTSKPTRPIITIATIRNVTRLLGVLAWAYVRASVVIAVVLLAAVVLRVQPMFDSVGVNPVLYVVSLFFGMPVLTIVVATGLAARFPLACRCVFLAAFLGFSFIWSDVAALAQMLLVGSMLATRLLPRSSVEQPPPAEARGAAPAHDAADYDSADARLRMVLAS